MRKSSYFAMSLLLTAFTAQAADTMGGAGVSGSTSVSPSGTSSSLTGGTPSPTGTNTTPMQNPVGGTSATMNGSSNTGSGATVNSQGYSTTPAATMNNQTTANPRNSTVDTTTRSSTDAGNVSSTTGTLQGSAPTVTTTTTTTGTPNTTTSGTAPDNTRINARDRGHQTLTPGDQGNNRADVTTTSAVRRALVKSDMSTTARNIKIITTNGRVTLRGPVKTEAEKARIEALAKAAAGASAVDNQLDVKANTTY